MPLCLTSVKICLLAATMLEIAAALATPLHPTARGEETNATGPTMHSAPPPPTGSNEETNATVPTVHSVPLLKQYVPLPDKNGNTWAYKTSYFGEITTGTNKAQRFTVIFDTGSGHIILPASSCTSKACKKHRRYNRILSPSVVDIEGDGTPLSASSTERDQVGIHFGTGDVLGEFVKEEVCVGLDPACVTMHVILALTMSDDPFDEFFFDGVMGLGLDALTLNDKFSFFGQMVGQKPQMRPLFAVFLSQSEDGESLISFGGYDEKLAASPIEYVPIANPELGFWQVKIQSVKIGDQVLEECENGECRAVLDTGTSLLGVPRMAHRSMHSKLARPVPAEAQNSAEAVDCRGIAGKMIHFDLGSIVVSLHVEDYSRPTPVNMTIPQKSGFFSSEAPSWKLMCRSLLLPIEKDSSHLDKPMFIFGEPFLRRYYTVWDYQQKRVGFSLAGEPYPRSAKSKALSRSIPQPPLGSLLPGAPLASLSKRASEQVVEV